MKLNDLTIKEVKKKLLAKKEVSEELLLKLKADNRKGINKLAKRVERKRRKQAKLETKFEEMKNYEKQFWQQGKKLVAGIDEAGRGPLAGPVVAAAVIFPEYIYLPGLDDSKKLSKQKREELSELILLKADAVGVGIVGDEEIDKINILQATYQAMRIAIADLKYSPQQLLVDGGRIPAQDKPQLALVDGDSKSISIAAASIIAKVTRDDMLVKIHKKYPEYNFKQNKGYGTAEHIAALEKYGPCPIHRESFSVVRENMVIDND